MKKVRQFIDTSGKLSQEGFLKKLGIPKTFLTFHNLGSYTSEFVEIGMPYMIIYEATDRKHGELNSLEFTESNKNYFFCIRHFITSSLYYTKFLTKSLWL